MADVTVLTGASLARTATRFKAIYIGTVGYTSNRGAAGTPVFTFEEDPTTGIYSSAASVLDFASAGLQTMSISAVGLTSSGAAPGSGAPVGLVTQNIRVYTVQITPLSVAANTTAEQSFTISGLLTNDAVFISPSFTPPAAGNTVFGAVPIAARVRAADTLTITFVNPGTNASTPSANASYRVLAIRTAS